MIHASPHTLARLRKLRIRGGAVTLLANNANWNSPSGPVGSDYRELYYGIQPIPTDHPPSLKNPVPVKTPMAQDGWKEGDSAKAKKQAVQDLVEIHKRLRRQQGKPEIAQQALIPSTVTWEGV